MSLFLYTLDSQQGQYRQIREISLSGKASPFRKLAAETGSQWHATGVRLLALLEVERPAEHRILIDLKPSDKNNVSLYRLRDVWGYSYDGWTPLALRLETLLGDDPRDNPATFKHGFAGQ